MGGDALFQVLDLLVLIENLVELGLQRLAVVDSGVRPEDALGEAIEPAGPVARQRSEMPMPCFIAKRSVSAGPPSMTTAVSL